MGAQPRIIDHALTAITAKNATENSDSKQPAGFFFGSGFRTIGLILGRG